MFVLVVHSYRYRFKWKVWSNNFNAIKKWFILILNSTAKETIMEATIFYPYLNMEKRQSYVNIHII